MIVPVMRTLSVALAAASLLCAAGGAQRAEFRGHTVESKIPGGYSVLIADFNRDGKPDILALSSRVDEVAWYENPSWERHVIAKGMRSLLYAAAADLDGDGVPELAVVNGFSMVYARSEGVLSLLKSRGDPRELWDATRIDAIPTTHRVLWADLDGDGRPELVNAPLIGSKSLAPGYADQVSLFFYRVPAKLDGEWKRFTIDDQLNGITHAARAVTWQAGDRLQLITAGFDGLILHASSGTGAALRWTHTPLARGHAGEATLSGSSDVAVGRVNGKRFLAALEPWHGNELAVYLPASGGEWSRNVVFGEIGEAHEVCLGDFNSDRRDEIVVADRGKGKVTTPLIFYAEDDSGQTWSRELLDPQAMSASGCAVADLNGDGRQDIIMIGDATANVKWYENLGTQGGAAKRDSGR